MKKFSYLRRSLALLALLPVAASLHAQLHLTVGVTQPPSLVAEAGTDGVICLGDSTSIGGAPSATGGTSPYTYLWSTTDTSSSVVVSPTATTTYLLEVTDVRNCTSSDSVEVVVNIPPSAGFSSLTTLLTADFTDLSAGSVVTWAWDFGDGGTSSLQNPTHTYAADGIYYVCLTVTDSVGCSAMSCDSITVIGVGTSTPQKSATFTVSPNPWTHSTMINFDLTTSSDVQLGVYDLQGRLLATLQNGRLPAGPHRFELGASQLGNISGAHIVKLTLNGKSTSQTIVHLH